MDEDSLESLGSYSICGGEGPPSPSGYPGEYSSAIESSEASDEEEDQPDGGEFVFQNNFIEVALRVQHLQGPHYWFSIGLRVTLDGRRWFRLPTFETNISWDWPGQTVEEEQAQLRNGRRHFRIVEVFDDDDDEENSRDPPTQPSRRSARLAAAANPEN